MVKRKSSDTSHFTWIEDHVAAASLAYKDDNISDLNDTLKLSAGWSFLKSIEGSKGVKLKMWVSTKNGNVLIAFRGTSSLKEAKLDLTAGSDGFKTAKGEDRGNVWRGFSEGFQDIKEPLENEIRLLREMDYLPKGSILQFSGHSLGGALSELASTYFASKMQDVQVLETSIGAPTSGDKLFGDYSRSLSNLYRTRIVADGDPVANVKLPGMDYVEKHNVIDFRSKKKNKSNLWDLFKSAGRNAIGLMNPGANLLMDGYAAKGKHSLDNYEKVLMEDFQDNRVESVNDNMEMNIQQNEEEYIQSKQADTPVTDAVCQCECHIHDTSIENGMVPPNSTGSIEQMDTPNSYSMISVSDLQNVSVKNTFDQSIQEQVPMNMTQLREHQIAMSEAMPSEIMDLINTSMESQLEREKEDMNKMQEKYALLTNQTDEDVDEITKDRTTFQRNRDDIQYFQERIQFELDHPEYVPDDEYGSKDNAVQFRNRLNRLYKMILQASTKKYVNMKESATKPDEDDIERMVELDQTEQMESAQKTNTLNPEDQSSRFVFDLSKLTDLDTSGPETEKQLVEWLSYPDMNSRELFNILKSNMTSQYQEDRMKLIREKEQDKRKTAAENLKNQLDNYHNQEGTGKYDQFVKQRTDFFTSLSQNADFQMLVKQNRINVKSLASKYKKDGDDVMIMKDLFGYDPRTVNNLLEQKYQDELLNIPTDMDPTEKSNMMQEVWKKFQINKMYPWVESKAFQDIYKQNKDNSTKLLEAVEKLKPTIPSNYKYDPAADTSGFKPQLLQNNVEAIADNTKEIVNTEFKDYFKEYRSSLERSFGNEEEVRKMFKNWNPEASGVQKFFSGVKDVMNFGTNQKGGWYDKLGRYLGAGASPDFEDYARKHPELGYTYREAKSNEVFDFMHNLGGEIIAMRYGVNPTSILDNLAGDAPSVDSRGQLQSQTGATETDWGDSFNPYAFMSLGRDKENTSKQSHTTTNNTNRTSSKTYATTPSAPKPAPKPTPPKRAPARYGRASDRLNFYRI